MTLEELIDEIKQNWDKVLHPINYADEKHWDKLVRTEFAGWPVWNGSDIRNYGKCYHYQIIAHDGVLKEPGSAAEDAALIRALGGNYDSILLELSVVMPLYRLHAWQRTLKDVQDEAATLHDRTQDEMIAPESGLLKELYDRAAELAHKHGFSRVPEEWVHEIVPGVALEENDFGEVTVSNCLFLDAPNLW